MSLDGFAFQACSIDHSDISPFRINNLQSFLKAISVIVISPPMCCDHLRLFQYSRVVTAPRRMTEARQS